jgi:hypothetical protein
MVVERETPTKRPTTDENVRPITDKPKPTRSEQFLQAKREQAGLGLMQLVAFFAGMLGKFKILPVLPEDAAAIMVHSPPIAKSLADAASEDDKFAAIFDKLTAAGPYGGIIAAVTPLVMQVVANHNRGVRDGSVDPAQFGAVHPAVLMEMAGVTVNVNGSASGEDADFPIGR